MGLCQLANCCIIGRLIVNSSNSVPHIIHSVPPNSQRKHWNTGTWNMLGIMFSALVSWLQVLCFLTNPSTPTSSIHGLPSPVCSIGMFSWCQSHEFITFPATLHLMCCFQVVSILNSVILGTIQYEFYHTLFITETKLFYFIKIHLWSKQRQFYSVSYLLEVLLADKVLVLIPVLFFGCEPVNLEWVDYQF